MALKDKLMTLEDFKAVRDVDVASNSAQFTEIKTDLDALPVLTDDIKSKLLACFKNVVWNDKTQGEIAYQSLLASLGKAFMFANAKVGSIIDGTVKVRDKTTRILLVNSVGEHPIIDEAGNETEFYLIQIPQGATKATIIEHDGEPTTDNEYPFTTGIAYYENGAWVTEDAVYLATFSRTFVDISDYGDGSHYLWMNLGKWTGTYGSSGAPTWSSDADLSNVNTSAWVFVII